MASKYSLNLQLQLQSPQNVAQVVSSLQKQLGGVSVNVQVKNSKQAVQQVQQLTNATNAAKTAAEKMGDAFGVSLKRFAAFSLASRAIGVFTRYLSNAVDESIAFDRQLNRIKQVTRASEGALGDLTKEITRLAKTFGVASSEITETALILAQAGLNANDTKVALEALTKTRLSATFGDINETAEGAVALLAQFGEGAAALERQLSAVNIVSAQFAVESEDLIEVIRRTGGVFRTSGGNLEELLGLFTSVRATTREGAESIATALKTIFTRIQRPQTIEYLKQLGVELVNAEGAFVGPFEAIKRLSAAFGGLEQGSLKFIEIAEQIGGYRQIGKVIPLLQQFAVAERARQVALAGGQSLTEEAAIAQESLAIQFQKVREEFLALIRSTTQTDTFRILTKTVLTLATSLIRVADALKPVLPLLATFAAIKFTSNIGGFFGGIGQALQKRQFGGPIRKFARGGLVPGSGNRDTVPAMLTPGEFVIRKSSVNKLGAGTLAAMNENRYNKGTDRKGVQANRIREAITSKREEKNPTFGTKQPFTTLNVKGQDKKTNIEYARLGIGDDFFDKDTIGRPAFYGAAFLSPVNISKRLTGYIDLHTAAKKRGLDQKQLQERGIPKKKNIVYNIGSLNEDVSTKLENSIYKGVIQSVKTGSKTLSSEVGTNVRLTTPKLAKILKQSNIDNIIGNIFEAMISATGAPYNPESRDRKANATFDFPKGLGKIASKFRNTKLTRGKVDAKTRFTAENVQSLIRKAENDQLKIYQTNVKKLKSIKSSKPLFNKTTLTDQQKNQLREKLQLMRTTRGAPLTSYNRQHIGTALEELGIDRNADIGDALTASAGGRFKLFFGGAIQRFSRGGKSRRKAYVFDFDDTLGETEARVGAEPNNPDKFSQFRGDLAAKLIDSGQATKIAGMARKRAQLGHDIYVLTARPGEPQTVDAINRFMQRIGAPAKGVIGVGNMFAGEREPGKRPGTTRLLTTGSKKAKILAQIAPNYDQTWFLDDAVENLISGKQVAGVKTALADTKAKRTVKRFAKGGAASDTVPALLTPGEFVINKGAAQRIGYGNLDRMNKKGVAGFAKGGPVAVQKFSTGKKVKKGLNPIIGEDYLSPDPNKQYRARGNIQAELAPGALRPKESVPDVKPLADRVGDFLDRLFRVAEKKVKTKTGINPGSQTNFNSARTQIETSRKAEISATKNRVAERVQAISYGENKESRLKQRRNQVLQRYNNDSLREKLKQVKEKDLATGQMLGVDNYSSPEQRAIEAELKSKRQQAKKELESIKKQIAQNREIVATQQKALEADKKRLNELNKSANISKTASATATATAAAKTTATAPTAAPAKQGFFGRVRGAFGRVSGAYEYVKDKAFGDDPNSPVLQARAKVDQLKEERKRIAGIGMTAAQKTNDPAKIQAIEKATEKRLAKIDKKINDSKTAVSTAQTQGQRRGMDPAAAFLGFGVLQNALTQMADTSGYANEKLVALSNGILQVTASVGLFGYQIGGAISALKEQGKKTGTAKALGGIAMGAAAIGAGISAYGNYVGEQGEKQYAKAVESSRGVEDFDRVKAAGDKNVEAQTFKAKTAGLADIGSFAAIGATIGSIFGPLGTVIGGLVGAIGGAVSALYKWLSVNEQAIKEEQNRKNADAAATAAAKTSEKAFKDLERGSARFAGPQGLGNFASEIAKANKVQREAAQAAGTTQEQRQKADEESTQRILQSAGEIGKRAKTEAEARDIIEKMAIQSGFSGEKLEELKKQAGGAAAAAVALRNAQEELARITIENTRLSSAFNAAGLAVDNFMNSLQVGSVGLVNTIATLEAAANNINMGPEGEQAIASIENAALSQVGAGTGFGEIVQNQASRARSGLALNANLASALQGVSGSLVAGDNSGNQNAVKDALLAAIPENADSDTRAKLTELINSQVSNLDLTSGTIPVDELMKNLSGQVKTSFIDPLSETGKALAQQQQRLVELTKTRIEAENRLVEAQKSALELQLEGAKIAAESFGGKKVTPADEFAIRARQFDVGGRSAGLGGIGAGSAGDIRRVSGEIRSRFAAQQAEFGGGGQGGGAAELDKDQRDRLKKANQDLINLTRQRVEQTKQELELIRKKNELEKSSIDKLLGGDVEGFMQDQAASAAANALRSGNTDLLGMFSAQTLGQAAKSLEGQLTPKEFASALGPVLSRFGIQDSRSAQVFAGATQEEQALMQRGQEEAGLLSELGQNEVGFAQMELKSAEMNIATANIKFQQALSESQARDTAAQESLAKQKETVEQNKPLKELEMSLAAAKKDEEEANAEAGRLGERGINREQRENDIYWKSIFGMSEQQKQAEIEEENAAAQRQKAAQEERKRIEAQIEEEKRKQQQVQAKARGGLIYASRGKFIPRGTDTVPAMLTPGEFVVRREAVQDGNNLQILQAMNRGGGGIASVLSNGTQALARGGTVQNITNNNNNIDVEQFTSAVTKLEQAIAQIPTEFFHQFNGSTNMSVTGLAGLTDVMRNIASDAVMQMAPKLRTDLTGNVQVNNSVLG